MRTETLTDLRKQWLHENAVSMLTVLIAYEQPELLKSYNYVPSEGEVKARYARLKNFLEKYQLSLVSIANDAIEHVVDDMDEHEITGFVQLPDRLTIVWPQLNNENRAVTASNSIL